MATTKSRKSEAPRPTKRRRKRSRKELPGIAAKQLTKVFKGGIRAVDGINLRVERGEIYGFLGPNGAGKSTTVHMLTTLMPPTSGRAIVGGHDIARSGQQVRRVTGAALQEVALDPNLTGREHLKLQAALQGVPRRERDPRATELLERVGLSDAADRRAGNYSGGMKRRLDLGLALVHRPSILFLDEPTTGLDVQSRTALWDEVRRLANEGVTIFLTTQYLEEADALADRVGIIHRGNIVAEGTPAALKAEIGRPTVEVVPSDTSQRDRLRALLEPFGTPARVGQKRSVAVRLDDPDGGLTGVVRALDSEGIEVANLELHRPTLDDVFLAKTGTSLEGATEGAPANGGTADRGR